MEAPHFTAGMGGTPMRRGVFDPFAFLVCWVPRSVRSNRRSTATRRIAGAAIPV